MKKFDPYTWARPLVKDLLVKIKNIEKDEQDISTGNAWSVKKMLILNYCIDGFLPIFKSHFDNYYYIDTHCGTGLIRFKKDLKDVRFPGSPLIAALHSNEKCYFTKYHFFDIDPNNIDILQNRINELELNMNTEIFNTKTYSFNKTIEFIQHLQSNDKSTNAFFVVIDPTGFKEVKWKLLKLLLDIRTADIFLIFMTYAISKEKGASKNNSTYRKSLTEFFGNDGWKFCDTQAELVELYKKQIHVYRTFVVDIPIYKTGKQLLYNVIIATNSQGAKNVTDSAQKIKEIDTKMIENALKENTGKTFTLDGFTH